MVGRSVVGLGLSLRGGSAVTVAKGVGDDKGRGDVRGRVGRMSRGLVGDGAGGVVVGGGFVVVDGVVVVGRSSTGNKEERFTLATKWWFVEYYFKPK